MSNTPMEPSAFQLLEKHIDGAASRLDARMQEILASTRLLETRVTDGEIKLGVHAVQIQGNAERLNAWAERNHSIAGLVQQIPQLVVDVRELGDTMGALGAKVASIPPPIDQEGMAKRVAELIGIRRAKFVLARDVGLVIAAVAATVSVLKAFHLMS